MIRGNYCGYARLQMRKHHTGFTLIELVIVITILSLLAGIALPKFASLQAEARLAKMNAALGAVKAAAAMAHATLITKGLSASYTGTPVPNIVIEGTVVGFVNGYPDLASIVPLAGLNGDYVTSGLTAPRVAASDLGHVGATTATDCTIGYTPAAAANVQPVYTVYATSENCT
jgi:MSHA pilin protein MshA